MAMIAQKSLLKAGASVLALAGMLGKLNSKFSEEGTNKAKKGYEKAANIKKENNSIIAKKVNPENTNESNIIHTTSPIANEKPVKQKFILSEEGATFPVTAENSQTNIEIDDEVQNLITVREKNINRVMGGNKAAQKLAEQKIAYAKHHKGYFDEQSFKKYKEEFGFHKSSAEYAKVGVDKQFLQTYALSKAEDGEDTAGFISGIADQMRKKFKDDTDALNYIDMMETELQLKHGSFNDYEGDKLFDWQQLNLDIDKAVDNLSSGAYKESAQRIRNGGLTDEELNTELTEATNKNKYFVWDDKEEELSEEEKLEQGIVF